MGFIVVHKKTEIQFMTWLSHCFGQASILFKCKKSYFNFKDDLYILYLFINIYIF